MRTTFLRRCGDWQDCSNKLVEHIRDLIQAELRKPAADVATSMLFLPAKIMKWEGGFAFESEVVWNPAAADELPGAAILRFENDAARRTAATAEWISALTEIVRKSPPQVEGTLLLA